MVDALVTTQWVADNADKVRLIEVDVDTTQYETGHIPGAVAFNWQSQLQDQVQRDIISKEDLEALLSEAGVSNGAPMTMVFLAVPAIRLALSVPLDLRANWVFRMSEDVDGRAEVVAASVRAVLALAVGLPLALVAPLQWSVMGPHALGVLLVEAAIGWLLVETLLSEWRRIPFTCSYSPGKGFVPLMFVKGFTAYVLFTVATNIVLHISVASPMFAVGAAVLLAGVAAVMRRRRAHHARLAGLTFEDELPTDVTPLRLND